MARPLRVEFAGALYHITARGNERKPIYRNDTDRSRFLVFLAEANERFTWFCHAYCLMTNHYHLLLETCNPNLSKGMRYLNGGYTQWFNRNHRRVGHLLQGRFKAILVERNTYLLELARYIALNPVRAGMVRSAEEWPWSSYRASAGLTKAHECLTTDWVLAGFDSKRRAACGRYRKFVSHGRGQPAPWENLRNQIFLGSDAFVEDVLSRVDPEQSLKEIPRLQRLMPAQSLQYYEARYEDRKLAMAHAYLSGHYTLEQVGRQFAVSYATVSRAVRKFKSSVKCKT